MTSQTDIDALVETYEGPQQSLRGRLALLVPLVAFTWSLWQLWIASPLPFTYGFGIFVDLPARGLHLAFGLLLGFLMFPTALEAARAWRNWITVAAAVCAFVVCAYGKSEDSFDTAYANAWHNAHVESDRNLKKPIETVESVVLAAANTVLPIDEVVAGAGLAIRGGSKVVDAFRWLGSLFG